MCDYRGIEDYGYDMNNMNNITNNLSNLNNTNNNTYNLSMTNNNETSYMKNHRKSLQDKSKENTIDKAINEETSF